jgi:prepilin-type N-terminal cleavage/methylation domain-containing protein
MQSKRSAFTLIEIIFTILLLGIIASGLPMLLYSDFDTREESIVQEAIYASTAKISQILSYQWDENSLKEANNTVAMSRILDVNSSIRDSEFDRNNSKFRIGHFVATGRRSLYDINDTNKTPALVLGPDLNETAPLFFDDIDDAINPNMSFIQGSGALATSVHGYKEEYNMSILVDYVDIRNNYLNTTLANEFEKNTSTVNATNMKRISISVFNSLGTILFSLRTYTANIGETSISSRIFN